MAAIAAQIQIVSGNPLKKYNEANTNSIAEAIARYLKPCYVLLAEFYGDETPLSSHETLSFSLRHVSKIDDVA